MFPQFESKWDSEPIFTAEDFLRVFKSHFDFPPPERLVLCPGKMPVAGRGRIKKVLNAEYVANDSLGLLHNMGLGAPQMAFFAEIFAALGVKEMVLVGTAGAISADLKIGDIVLCERALRDDGVSQHYVQDLRFAESSVELNAKIQAAAGSAGFQLPAISSWTTDAIFRETHAEIEETRRLGISTVEMEAAALFTVQEVRKFRASAIFVISDRVLASGWEFPKRRFGTEFERVIGILKTVP